MTKEEAIGELTIKATMLQGIPIVSLEDCTRVIQEIDKTEPAHKRIKFEERYCKNCKYYYEKRIFYNNGMDFIMIPYCRAKSWRGTVLIKSVKNRCRQQKLYCEVEE